LLVLYAYRITNDQSASEDLVTEIFVNLWKKSEGFQDIQSIKPYLYTAARNRALTWLERNKRENQRYLAADLLKEISDKTIIDDMIYAETLARIFKAMDELPGQCRKVFILHYIEGKKISEIATELKISVSSVRTHRGRGIDLLKRGLLGLVVFLSQQI
ncbi:MAG: sigma-70 family RNA polymerase sigma factor, partial [Bacteroidota bacterium]|nr:sigma-70 family RNA polymerase sigma factor [Bacteroidota bacterium]